MMQTTSKTVSLTDIICENVYKLSSWTEFMTISVCLLYAVSFAFYSNADMKSDHMSDSKSMLLKW